jgi:hypothetical protein
LFFDKWTVFNVEMSGCSSHEMIVYLLLFEFFDEMLQRYLIVLKRGLSFCVSKKGSDLQGIVF